MEAGCRGERWGGGGGRRSPRGAELARGGTELARGGTELAVEGRPPRKEARQLAVKGMPWRSIRQGRGRWRGREREVVDIE
jgi:hypothetical protein